MDTLRIFTLASKVQQQKWLDLFKSENEYAPQGYRLKEWLFGGDEIPTENALFNLSDYQGTIVTDLFEETRYFDDSQAFWELQNTAIAKARDAYLEAGWQEVIILDVGQYFQGWDYVKASMKKDGRVYNSLTTKGEVTFHEGFITRKEAEQRARKANGEEESKQERPELTKAMQNYFNLHRHSAVRHDLLQHQDIALCLIATQLLAGSSLIQAQADPQKAATDAIEQSVNANVRQQRFEAERGELRKLLGLQSCAAKTLVYRANEWDKAPDSHRLFAKLLTLSKEDVLYVLTFITAETLPVSSETVEGLGKMLHVDMSGEWQSDEIFFDLLKDKQAINAILKEVGGKTVADAHISSTANVQKKIKQDTLNGKRDGGKTDWQPRYINFPMKIYTKRGGINAVERWKRIKKYYA